MPDPQQYCTFLVDGHYFGLDVRKVQEIIRYQEMTSVPLASPVVRGLINLRGQIVTAIDLRRRLDLTERPEGTLPMNVVVRTEEGVVSLLVDEIGDAFWNVFVGAALTPAVEGMHPRAVVHHPPERVLIEFAQVGDMRHGDLLDALFVKGPREMMMVDHVIAAFRTEHHRYHVLTEKFSARLGGELPPAFAFFVNLANSYGDLSRTKIVNGDRGQSGFANHNCVPPPYTPIRQYGTRVQSKSSQGIRRRS